MNRMTLAAMLLACSVGGAWAQSSANVSANPPNYPASGTAGLSQTRSGGLRVQPQDGAGNDVSTSHPLPVAAGPAAPSATTDASSTITVGGTFQTLTAANTARLSFEFINICNVTSACTATTNYCYLFFAASGSPSKTTNAIPIPPGGSYLRSSGSIPSDAIQGTCDGTGDHFRLAIQ